MLPFLSSRNSFRVGSLIDGSFKKWTPWFEDLGETKLAHYRISIRAASSTLTTHHPHIDDSYVDAYTLTTFATLSLCLWTWLEKTGETSKAGEALFKALLIAFQPDFDFGSIDLEELISTSAPRCLAGEPAEVCSHLCSTLHRVGDENGCRHNL